MASRIGYEPFPNGGIINMGAYGATAEASKSYFGEPVCETIVAGDINGDCKVDLADFAFMAFHWLEDNNPPDSNSVVQDNIEYYIHIDKTLCSLAEHVDILCRVTNLGDSAADLGLYFPPHWYHLVITDGNGIKVWQWPWPQPVIPPEMFGLAPGEHKGFEIQWNVVNQNGTEQEDDDFTVDPGRYNITAEVNFIVGEGVRVSIPVEVRGSR
jgi:hypothetical protein